MAMISDQKYEELCEILTRQVKVTPTLRKVLRLALNEVGLGDVSAEVAETHATKVRGKNGYNLYYSQRNTELKDTVPDGKVRRDQIKGEWKEFSDEIKAEWKQKALVLAPPPEKAHTPVEPKQKKISGWNLFVAFKMTDAEFKGQYEDHTNRMKAIGPIWKAMSQAEKDEWNAKVTKEPVAEEVPKEVPKEVVAEATPAPVPVVEAPKEVVAEATPAPVPVVEVPKEEVPAPKKKRATKKAPVASS